MDQFIYILGHLLYDCFTLWLAMLGVLFLFDVVMSRRNGHARERWQDLCVLAAGFTAAVMVVGSVDFYIISPALGAGINFFFES